MNRVFLLFNENQLEAPFSSMEAALNFLLKHGNANSVRSSNSFYFLQNGKETGYSGYYMNIKE